MVRGTSKRTPSRGADEKNLHVPAQVNFITSDQCSLALARRTRRGKTSKRTPSRGADEKNLHVPAQVNSITSDQYG